MRERFLRIEGLESDIRLFGCEDLEACLPTVFAGMPHSFTTGDASIQPFASVVGNAGRYRLHAPHLGAPSYQSDAVNAACDLAGLVARQYVWGRTDRLALHAAAVAVNGVLVVFPAQRRAGKSLLTMAAAQLGARVFSDDVLPIEFVPGSPIMGVAMGIAPRVRLPLPFSRLRLAEGDTQRPVVQNRQYRYVAVPGLATAGEKLPIGAFVAMERRDDGPAMIEQMPRGAMLGSLLTQNFGRGPEAGTLLAGLHALVVSVPSFRLTYSDPIEAAARVLSDIAPQLCPSAPVAPPERPPAQVDTASLSIATGDEWTYWRRTDAKLHELEGEYYAANAHRDRVLHLNDGMLRIWTLLAEPTNLREAVLLMQAAFADIPAERVAGDVAAGFNGLAGAGLIVPTKEPIANCD